MKVLITGVGGFIANNVAEWLYSNSEHEIIGTYRKSKPKSKGFKSFQCDLYSDPEKISDYKFDVVVHFASQLYGSDIKEFLDNTVQATRNILNIAERMEIKKFIYISSISVCGETRGVISETSDYINLNDYEMTKLIGERLLEDSKIEEKIVLRLPRVLGKGIDYSAPWLPKVSYDIMQSQKVFYYNPSMKYNALIHTNDLAQFILYLINDEVGSDVYMLGAKDEMSILEILEFLKEKLHSTSELIEVEKKGVDRCHLIDVSKAKKAGFKPKMVKDILERYVQDMKNGEDNYASM